MFYLSVVLVKKKFRLISQSVPQFEQVYRNRSISYLFSVQVRRKRERQEKWNESKMNELYFTYWV